MTGVFQEKKRGEYRCFPGKVPKKIDLERIVMRLLCLLLLSLLLFQNKEAVLLSAAEYF